MRHYILLLLLTSASNAHAATYPLPPIESENVVGEIQNVAASKEDTLIDIARRFDLGYEEIVKANPAVNRWVPGEGTPVVVPTKFVLPDAPRKGIVLNLAELRLYYYPPAGAGDAQFVHTFPISIGRMDWKSPIGETKVVRKEKDPAWRPTASIKSEHAAEGDPLPNVIPGGTAENPLGHYALYLAKAGYLIHGTDERKENGIGMRVTHGCVRMYPEDIERLYALVDENTPVVFIDQPVKAGWRGPDLFVEVHTPLPEDPNQPAFEYTHAANLQEAQELIAKTERLPLKLDVEKIGEILRTGSGVPTQIAQTDNLLPLAQTGAQPERRELPEVDGSYATGSNFDKREFERVTP